MYPSGVNLSTYAHFSQPWLYGRQLIFLQPGLCVWTIPSQRNSSLPRNRRKRPPFYPSCVKETSSIPKQKMSPGGEDVRIKNTSSISTQKLPSVKEDVKTKNTSSISKQQLPKDKKSTLPTLLKTRSIFHDENKFSALSDITPPSPDSILLTSKIVSEEDETKRFTQEVEDLAFLCKFVDYHRYGPCYRHQITILDHQIGGGCIIISGKEVLLVLNNHSNLWGFPKGYAKEGDKYIHKTALRELEEETGVTLVEENLLNGAIRRHRYYYFVVCLTSFQRESICLDIHDVVEIGQVGWYNLQDIRTMSTTRHVQSILLEARY